MLNTKSKNYVAELSLNKKETYITIFLKHVLSQIYISDIKIRFTYHSNVKKGVI